MKGIIVGFNKINVEMREERKEGKHTKVVTVPGEAIILQIQTAVPEVLPVGKLIELTVIEEPKKKKKSSDDDEDEEGEDEEETEEE